MWVEVAICHWKITVVAFVQVNFPHSRSSLERVPNMRQKILKLLLIILSETKLKFVPLDFVFSLGMH